MSGKLIAVLVVVVLVVLYFSQSPKAEGASLTEYSARMMRGGPNTSPANLMGKAKQMLNSFMVSAEPSALLSEGYTSPVGRVRRSPAIVVPGTHIRATSATI